MSTTHTDTFGQGSAEKKREERKVLAGTLVGTTIEWYDFFIYAQAAALVFAPLFFAPHGRAGRADRLVGLAGHLVPRPPPGQIGRAHV